MAKTDGPCEECGKPGKMLPWGIVVCQECFTEAVFPTDDTGTKCEDCGKPGEKVPNGKVLCVDCSYDHMFPNVNTPENGGVSVEPSTCDEVIAFLRDVNRVVESGDTASDALNKLLAELIRRENKED